MGSLMPHSPVTYQIAPVLHWASDQCSSAVVMVLITTTLFRFRIYATWDYHHRLSNDTLTALKKLTTASPNMTLALEGSRALQQFLTGPRLTKTFFSHTIQCVEALVTRPQSRNFLESVSQILVSYEWSQTGRKPFEYRSPADSASDAIKILRAAVHRRKGSGNRWMKQHELTSEASQYFVARSIAVWLVGEASGKKTTDKDSSAIDTLEVENDPKTLLNEALKFMVSPLAPKGTWRLNQVMCGYTNFIAEILEVGALERSTRQKLENESLGNILAKEAQTSLMELDFSDPLPKLPTPGGRIGLDPKAWLPRSMIDKIDAGAPTDWSLINADYFGNWFRGSAYLLHQLSYIKPIQAYRWGILEWDGLPADVYIFTDEAGGLVEDIAMGIVSLVAQRIRSSMIYETPSIYRFVR